ncbi:MAG TPA: radical SAM protein [Candidatus Omnitrophota bacterium]|nr:radical SAM protein [Candidatus Omnitrophota bacterium]HPT39205.1 radical SAM protein [Candidatus Omnitrophota bacterium]
MKDSSCPAVFNFNKVMIDVTTRCNLECPVCYRIKNSQEDISFEVLKKLARRFRGKIISLCGGEPTVREDLSEIIGLFSRQNTVFLITNGLKLTDYAYLKKLKNSGLRYISFSFNGFSDQVYDKINGRPLLELKLKALDNIKRAGIKTILSVVIVKGLNESQISGILKYCLANRDFIQELRLRTMVPISKYLSAEKYSVTELLEMVCKEASINKDDVLKELMLKQGVNRFLGKEVFRQKACSFDFHLKRKGTDYFPVGQALSFGCPPADKINGIFLLSALFKAYGFKMLAEGFLKTVLGSEKKPWIHSENIFKVGLRSWPTGNEINLIENKDCQTGYYLDDKILPFCYANILKENKK